MSKPSGSSDLSRSKALSPLIPAHSGLPNINKLDHQIRLQNGSTSILELSPQRLQLAKQNPPLSLSARVEELTRELGHLRQEIQFYRQSFEILQRLRETVYDVSQQLFLAHYLDHDVSRLDDIIAQLRNALEDSKRREFKAEKAWMEFWGIDYIAKEHKGDLI
jgi:predicted RNase H-like nuclease (RuvC/YqgF family)